MDRVWAVAFAVHALLGAAVFVPGVAVAAEDAGTHVPVLTRAPELLEFITADYPSDAERAGKTAAVRLRVTIGVGGSVLEAKVPEPVGDGFDEAAVAAVKQFKFRPAEVDGVPAAVQIEYVYNFTLKPPPLPEELPPPAPAVLKGELHARGSRTLVPAALIQCGDESDAPQARSDSTGRFQLRVSPGSCEVHVEANGYHAFHTKEQLQPGETLEVIYYLEPKAGDYEIVVKGERDTKEVVRRTVTRDEVRSVPGTFGDPVRVIQNFPGVARAPFGLGQLIVRGASPAQTLTFMDGVEIPLLFHLLGGPSVVNAAFLDRVDFFPGGFGARYGRAVGGIVDVTTRSGAQDTFHGEVKLDVLDGSAYATTRIVDGISISAGLRRSIIDALIPLLLPKDPNGGTLLVLPRYWDYQLRLDIGKPPKDLLVGGSTFSFFAFGSDDQLSVVSSGGTNNQDLALDTHTLFHRMKGNWTYRKGNFTSVLSPYLGYDLGRFVFGGAKIAADIYSAGLREDLSLRIGEHIVARAGLDFFYEHLIGMGELPVIGGTQYVDFPGASPIAETQVIKKVLDGFDGALYAEVDFKWGPLTVTPGLRATMMREVGQTRYALDPRIWVKVQVTPRALIKGSAGLYSQRPPTTSMIQAPFGNPNLIMERAFQSSIGASYQFTDAISLDVTGFFNRRYENIVSPGNVIVQPDQSVTQEAFSNDGLGRAYGLEVLLRHEMTDKLYGWVAYTLSRSLERRVGETDYVLGTFDQTHILTLVASYKLPWGFELGARFRYVTGRPTTPVLHPNDLYNADSDSYNGTPGAAGSTRLAAFHQLDIRLEKVFVFKSWSLAAYADVQNVYNQRNQEAVFYDYRFRRQYTVPGIPVLPVVGVRASF